MPAEDYVNTNELRFVSRPVPFEGSINIPAGGGAVVTRSARILQQRWVRVGTMRGWLDDTNSEWRDVPLVEE